MDIDSYIAKYGPEWRRLEGATSHGTRALSRLPGEQLSEIIRLYVRTSGHLAEVRVRYQDPGLEQYLNGVVAAAHAAIYSAHPRTVKGFVRLFGARYREAIRATAPFIAVAAALLLVVAGAVTVWIATSPGARTGLLPAGVHEAIRRADGSAADLGLGPAGVSTLILFNNVQVAFLAFALGITLGAGTIWVLMYNAVLIGALAGAFEAAGKGAIFWSLVLPHGFLELTAIAIAAGAGLRMGWSIVDPGDRPRGRALTQEALGAVIVIVGVIPAFALAAVIEGFITPFVPGIISVPFGAIVAAGYVAFLFGRRPLRLRRDTERVAAPGPAYSRPADFTRR